MEMYHIKETVLQDNTYPKYLENVMDGRHRWGHLYSRFQGIFLVRSGTHGRGRLSRKKARKKFAGTTETARLKSTKGLAPKVRHLEINTGNTHRNISFHP